MATPHATAQVYSHGAHLAAWQPSHAGAPVLWMSDHSLFRRDKPIRGGVPICFPWFGPHPSDRAVPAHGFARLSPWTLCEAVEAADGTVALTFQLEADNASPVWPHLFHADLHLFIGRRSDRSRRPQPRRGAVHVRRGAPHLLRGLPHRPGQRLRPRAHAVSRQGRRVSNGGDRPRIPSASPAKPIACIWRRQRPASIDDPGLQRRITVSKDDSRSTVVWNPWIDKARAMPDFGDDEWRGMVCIETANVGEAAVRLRAGRPPSHDGVAGRRVTLIETRGLLPRTVSGRERRRAGAPPARCS